MLQSAQYEDEEISVGCLRRTSFHFGDLARVKPN